MNIRHKEHFVEGDNTIFKTGFKILTKTVSKWQDHLIIGPTKRSDQLNSWDLNTRHVQNSNGQNMPEGEFLLPNLELGGSLI